MDVFIDDQRGQSFRIEVRIFDTVLTMKQKIEMSQGIPVSKQTLYFGGKVLEDNLNIISCKIPPNAHLFLFISPDYNPYQNNDQGLQTQQPPLAAPSNPIDDFVINSGWLAIDDDDELLQIEQSSKPDKSFEELKKLLEVQDSPAVVEGESDQVRHQTQQSTVPSYSIGATFFDEDVALTTEHFSNIQSEWPPTTQEEIKYGQDLPPVKVGGNTNQVTQTKRPPPSDSVKEIIDITDSPEKKKIKMSPVKLTVMVTPFMETRKIPVEVNAGDKVKLLRKELVKMQQRGELVLPQEGYFFIHNRRVLDDDQSFWWNCVAPNDTIEIFRGTYT